MTKNKNVHTLLYLLPLLLVSIFYSIDKSIIQTAINGGLILSGIVVFPSEYTNVTNIYFNGWTILHQITGFFLKLNINAELISIIIIFFSNTFHTFGIFLLSKGVTKSSLFAVTLALWSIILRHNFGHTDYPVLIFSEHSYGMLSLSLFTLIVGLMANNNFRLFGFFSIILIGIHLVVGLWVLSIIIFIYFLQKKFIKKKLIYFKEISIGITVGLIPILISLYVFSTATVDKILLDVDSFQIYMSAWDHHRNNFSINYSYLFKTILLVILSFSLLVFLDKNDLKKNLNFMLLFIIITCLGSSLIYLAYKIFPNFFPSLILRGMPTRLSLLHTLVGYPLLLSIIFFFIKHFIKIPSFISGNKKIKILALLVLPISILFLVNANKIGKNIIKRVDVFNENFSKHKNIEEKKFWASVRNLKTEGYFVTTINSITPTIVYGNKPYILNVRDLDHIPYHPETAKEVKNIIENIYGLDFNNPPKKYVGGLKDEWYKEIFEERSQKIWSNLSEEFNLSGIIIPNNWHLKINKNFSYDKFAIYLIK